MKTQTKTFAEDKNHQLTRTLAGWNSKHTEGLRDYAISIFGKNPNEDISWKDYTLDRYANVLLSCLIGALPVWKTHIIDTGRGTLRAVQAFNNQVPRVFLRVLVMNELNNYIRTGQKTPDFMAKYHECDKTYYPTTTKYLN